MFELLIRTRACTTQGWGEGGRGGVRSASFSDNFTYVLNKKIYSQEEYSQDGSLNLEK